MNICISVSVFICIFICTYIGCRWTFQYKPFLLGRWLLLTEESLYQNPLVSPLLNDVSETRNSKSQGVDGMFDKVRDPCSLERISRTPGHGFPGRLCLWVCGVHRWWEPTLGWHSEDLRAGRSQGSQTGPLGWWPVQGCWVVCDGLWLFMPSV